MIQQVLSYTQMREALRIQDAKKDPKWLKFRPRKFIIPQNYANPNVFNLSAFSAQDFSWERLAETEKTLYILRALGEASLHNDTPVFFVAKRLFEALTKTDPPSTEFLSIKWPFQTILFMPPLDLSEKLLGFKFIYGAIGKIITHTSLGVNDAACTCACIESDEGGLQWFHSHSPIIGSVTTEMLTKREMTEYGEQTPHYDSDKDISTKLVNMMYNLLFVMTACPELISRGTQLRAESTRFKTPSLWSPNFLGASYQQKTEGHTGVSPRMHWRRGHWRHQRHGKGFSELKVIWIEPVLVNSED